MNSRDTAKEEQHFKAIIFRELSFLIHQQFYTSMNSIIAAKKKQYFKAICMFFSCTCKSFLKRMFSGLVVTYNLIGAIININI